MLNYSTCKALKEAGFSQDTEVAYYWVGTQTTTANDKEEKIYQAHRIGEEMTLDSVHECACPSLEELIEACLEKQPGHFHLDFLVDTWAAGIDCEKDDWITGKTKKEAVSALYLSLNKKP